MTGRWPLQGCSKQGSQVVAQVVDTCDTCDSTTLNLPYKTFQTYLGPPSAGNLGILYQQASFTCRPESEPRPFEAVTDVPVVRQRLPVGV